MRPSGYIVGSAASTACNLDTLSFCAPKSSSVVGSGNAGICVGVGVGVGVGAGPATLSTVAVTEPDVVLFPAASLATAVRTRRPSSTVAVFHEMEYGEEVSSDPTSTPSTLNCTPLTPISSDAVADIFTIPETVAPFDGSVIETVGAMVSEEVVTPPPEGADAGVTPPPPPPVQVAPMLTA